jgi:hypothetical protein
MKVNLFLIGASKCGTTFMHDLLSQHPLIEMSVIKEPRHFQKSMSEVDILEYHSLFNFEKGATYYGESSPNYSETTVFTEVPRKIYKYNPNAKIIYLVRNPFERLKPTWIQAQSSGHWHEVKMYEGKMPFEFRDAVFDYPPFLEACRYWTHLKNYRNYFSDSNILVLLFEKLTLSPLETMDNVFEFLEVDGNVPLNFNAAHKNSSDGKEVFNPWRAKVDNILPKMSPLFLKNWVRTAVGRVSQMPFKPPNLTNEDVQRIHFELSPEVKGLYSYLNIDNDPWQFFVRANELST